ncbi:MAG: hypothetical protein R6T98_15025 [Desulfatiglandales bacterium]
MEDIIDPRETRYRLFCLIEAAQNYLQTELGPKPHYGDFGSENEKYFPYN